MRFKRSAGDSFVGAIVGALVVAGGFTGVGMRDSRFFSGEGNRGALYALKRFLLNSLSIWCITFTLSMGFVTLIGSRMGTIFASAILDLGGLFDLHLRIK